MSRLKLKNSTIGTMKKLRYVYAASAALLLVSGNAFSQDLRMGFFLDNYLYGYRMNPASQSEVSNTFFGLLINDVAIGASSDIGLSNLLFPTDGRLVTGFNSSISADKFISGLKVSNKLTTDLNENIFALGHRTSSGKGFWTIEANLKSYSAASAPMSMFEYLKVGASDNIYRMNDINLNSKNYGELAIGYSHRFTDKLKIGVTAKGILGLGYADMSIARLAINTKKYPAVATGIGTFTGALPPADFGVTPDGCIDFRNVNRGSLGISGIGGALDLGIEYELIEGLRLSAAVLDLGAIAWKKTVEGTMGEHSFNVLENADLSDNLADMLRFSSDPTGGILIDMLNTQINFGAKYILPFAEKVSLGALYTFRLGDKISQYIDFRTGATYTPGKAFSVSGTVGVNTYGTTVGAAFTVNAGPVNLFAGIDGIFVNVTPQFVPINSLNTVAKAGLSFMIGR